MALLDHYTEIRIATDLHWADSSVDFGTEYKGR